MAENSPGASDSTTAPTLPAIVEAMLRPEFYAERPDNVELVQTHISYVFIAGTFVYKLKKAVRFSFIDSADVARRRRLCEDEIRLNRRLAPDVYVGMFPIYRIGADFMLGDHSRPHDEVVDYVIKMRRLPAECMLDRMLARGAVGPSTIRALAAVIADFYRTASSAHAEKYGAASALWHRIVGEMKEMEPLVGSTLGADEFRIIDGFCRGFISTHWRMLNARAESGRVREGHGDLRGEHICLEEGKVSVFDCVEFSERLRTCDLASEVAFLAMDLDRFGRPDLADELVGAIRDMTNDDELPRLIPFYKCYRAVIRGVVESLRGHQKEVADRERDSAIALAHRYFALACEYARGAAPALVVVCGLSGSGKSTLARALQHRCGFPIVSSDRTRKNLSSIPAESSAADAYRSGIYADTVTQATYAAMLEEAQRVVSDGNGVILDATYQDVSHRKAVLELASQMKVPVLFLECRSSDAEIRRRLIERQKAGHNPSDADVNVYLRQRQDFAPLGEIPSSSHLIVDTAQPLGAIVSDAQRALAGRQR